MEQFGTTIDALRGHFDELRTILDRIPADSLKRVFCMVAHAGQNGKSVWVLGNNGTVSIANHFAYDLAKASVAEGRAWLRAASLSDQLAALTAWVGDNEYESVLALHVRGLISAGDVVIAISASGGSPAMIEVLKIANEIGAQTVGLTGLSESDINRLADTSVVIPSYDCGIIEDCQLAIGHALAEAIQETNSRQAVTVSPTYLAIRRAQGKRSQWISPLVG